MVSAIAIQPLVLAHAFSHFCPSRYNKSRLIKHCLASLTSTMMSIKSLYPCMSKDSLFYVIIQRYMPLLMELTHWAGSVLPKISSSLLLFTLNCSFRDILGKNIVLDWHVVSALLSTFSLEKLLSPKFHA